MPRPRRSLVALLTVALAGCAARPIRWGVPGAAAWPRVPRAVLAVRFVDGHYPPFPSIGTRDAIAQRHDGGTFGIGVRLCVARSGEVALVEVVRRSGDYDLDADAVATVRTWRFSPGYRDACTVVGFRYAPVFMRARGPREILRR